MKVQYEPCEMSISQPNVQTVAAHREQHEESSHSAAPPCGGTVYGSANLCGCQVCSLHVQYNEAAECVGVNPITPLSSGDPETDAVSLTPIL